MGRGWRCTCVYAVFLWVSVCVCLYKCNKLNVLYSFSWILPRTKFSSLFRGCIRVSGHQFKRISAAGNVFIIGGKSTKIQTVKQVYELLRFYGLRNQFQSAYTPHRTVREKVSSPIGKVLNQLARLLPISARTCPELLEKPAISNFCRKHHSQNQNQHQNPNRNWEIVLKTHDRNLIALEMTTFDFCN